MIRVGRCTYKNGSRYDPVFEDFTQIIVLTKSSDYGELGPYCLKDKKGRIMENLWQAQKIYETVPYSKQSYSRYDKKVIWDWNAERHVKEKITWVMKNGRKVPDLTNEITPNNYYWRWRKELMECKHAVRYPVGYNHRHKCLCSFQKDPSEKLDYVEARKKIYLPIYSILVKREKRF